MKHLSYLAIATAALAAGCIDTQDHGARPDAGDVTDADGGIGSDAATPDVDATVRPDAGEPDAAGGDAGSGPTDPPPFLDVMVLSSAWVDVELVGGALTPILKPKQIVTVTAANTEPSITFHPSDTVGPCDLYPPLGSSTWPTSTIVPAETVPLPPEYVSIVAAGSPLTVESSGDEVVARGELPPGTHFVVTVTYPGHAPIDTEVVLEPPLSITTPDTAPATSAALEGEHARGTGLTITWPVEHSGTPTHTIDVTGGSRAAARCNIPYEDGTMTLSASDLATLFDPSDPSVSVHSWAAGAADSTVEGTRLRVIRGFGMPTVLLTQM